MKRMTQRWRRGQEGNAGAALQRWPSADALTQPSREELEDFARQARHGSRLPVD